MSRPKLKVNYDSNDYKKGHQSGYAICFNQFKNKVDKVDKSILDKNNTIREQNEYIYSLARGSKIITIFLSILLLLSIVLNIVLYIY